MGESNYFFKFFLHHYNHPNDTWGFGILSRHFKIKIAHEIYFFGNCANLNQFTYDRVNFF